VNKTSERDKKSTHKISINWRRYVCTATPDQDQYDKYGFMEPISKRTYLLMSLLIVAVSIAVYFNTLLNGFVYDDIPQVLENPWITNIKYIPDMFSKSVHGFQQNDPGLNYYRPVMHLLYLLNNYIFGLKPWGFHLTNIMFHAGVSVLIFIILFNILRQRSIAIISPSHSFRSEIFNGLFSIPFAAAMLFATHPIHTEAVTWVAGIPDLSFSFFCLLSLFLYIKSREAFHGRYLLSLVSFAIALFCKEAAVTFPLILMAFDCAFNQGKDRSALPWMKYIPYLAIIGFYFILRFRALGGFAPIRHSESLNVSAINVFFLFMLYLEKLFLPINLNFMHVLQPLESILELKGFLSIGVTIAFVLSALVSLQKNKLIFFGLVLIIVPLLPVFYIPGRGVNAFAERYLYLPSLGFVIIMALSLNVLAIQHQKVVVASLCTVLLVGLYSIGTVKRNTVWKNDITLFTDVTSKSPDLPHPHYYLGMTYMKVGDYDNAIEQLQTAIRLRYRMNDAQMYYALGVAFFKKDMMDKALDYFEMAEKLNPDLLETHMYLGMVYGNMGNKEKAIDQFEASLKLQPSNAEAHFDLGLIFADNGLLEEALKHFEAAVRINPANPYYRNRLNEFYKQRNTSR